MVFVCVYVGRWVCVREHLQRDQPWGCRCITAVEGEQRGGGELVHRRCSKQPTSLKTSPYLALLCTVQCLFIYLGWGANVCSVALDISDRKDQRATPQMKLSKWPTVGSRGEHPSLAHFIMIPVKPHSKEEREKGKKENHHLPNHRERKRDKTSGAVSSPSMME